MADLPNTNYDLFFKFIDKWSTTGLKNIDRNDPMILEMEEMLVRNKQFIYVADMIDVSVTYTSKNCYDLIAIQCDELSAYTIFTNTHPDDLQRHSIARTSLIKLVNDIFIQGRGSALMSTNFRLKNLQGNYTNFLIQGYAWYSPKPLKTVYCLFVNTDISWFGEIQHGHNSYLGNDLSNFRYPDEKLIMTGNVFSDREFEILKLIEAGLKSEQIAQELFLSVHTVNTHRRRILNKTGSSTLAELIHDLKEKGTL